MLFWFIFLLAYIAGETKGKVWPWLCTWRGVFHLTVSTSPCLCPRVHCCLLSAMLSPPPFIWCLCEHTLQLLNSLPAIMSESPGQVNMSCDKVTPIKRWKFYSALCLKSSFNTSPPPTPSPPQMQTHTPPFFVCNWIWYECV